MNNCLKATAPELILKPLKDIELGRGIKVSDTEIGGIDSSDVRYEWC